MLKRYYISNYNMNTVKQFKLLLLFAFYHITYSFFNQNLVSFNKITSRHYSRLKCSNFKQYKNEDKNNTTNVPILKPTPVPIISFDDLFLNWNIVNCIYLSSNRDRIVLIYDNNKKGVYYIDYAQLKKIEYLISCVSVSVSIEPVCNLDNPWFYLYCAPPSKRIELIDDLTFNNSNSNDEDHDDFDNDYGFGFGIGM